MSPLGESFRIGTRIHLLDFDGSCAFGFITEWSEDDQSAKIVAFREGGEPPFSGMFPHGSGITHDPTGKIEIPEGYSTFHLADTCPWNR